MSDDTREAGYVPWGGDWIGILALAWGIKGEIEKITVLFRTGQDVQAVIHWMNGGMAIRKFDSKGILEVVRLLNLPYPAQSLTFHVRADSYVTAEYGFIPYDVMASMVASCAVLADGESGKQRG